MTTWLPISTLPTEYRMNEKSVLIKTSAYAVEAWFMHRGALWICADDAFKIEVEETPWGYEDSPITHWAFLPNEEVPPDNIVVLEFVRSMEHHMQRKGDGNDVIVACGVTLEVLFSGLPVEQHLSLMKKLTDHLLRKYQERLS